jgi:tetratricopeptide (TPR) repeat protein
MKRVCILLLMIHAILIASSAAQAQSPQQTLNQYIADLQKNPNDYALREKIIRHVQTMRPLPAVPPDAEKFEGRAEFAIRSAKTEADFLDAAKEYEKAQLIAPWVPAYYFNQGIAFEKAGKLKDAKQSFEFYLLAAPNAQDAREVRKRIAGLEYAIEKAAKESSPAVTVAKKQKEYEDWLKKIDGRRYTYRDSFERITQTLDVKGKTLIRGFIVEPDSPVRGPRGYTEFKRYEIRGRVVEGPVINAPPEIKSTQDIFTVSEDGEKIHMECRLGRGKGREYDYYWQR